MFLSDPYSDVSVPEDTGTGPVTFTDDCIAFHVTPYVDGDADVTISNETPDSTFEKMFSGNLQCSSKFVSLSDSNVTNYCILRTIVDTLVVEVWHSDGESRRVWIKVDQLDIF